MINQAINSFQQIIVLVLFASLNATGQTKFDIEKLGEPSVHGPEIAAKLNTLEVEEYIKPDSNCVLLTNGFRQSTFINEDDWLTIKDTVTVDHVDIVYSKYPIRGGKYKEIYPLLFNRIRATISMDSDLNNDTISWNKILQTHCENNHQVSQLFHGVVIWYKTPTKKVDTVPEMSEDDVKKERMARIKKLNEERERLRKEREAYLETNINVEFILASPHLPDTVKTRLTEKPLNEQITLLSNYFDTIDFDNGNNEELSYLYYLNEVNQFLVEFPRVEPIILKVLDRHPEWKEKIVINDWTGSMYGYGAQVLEWHLMNLSESGISTITLFNDGDKKKTKQKAIGSTGGIYTQKTDEPAKLINLFNTVKNKGGGGDGPENDIEAILEAIQKQPEHSEIILIADNTACVRDIELANRINRPVRIILCGYDPKIGVNPHYVYLANKTGGGIYTIDNDVEQIKAETDSSGGITSFSDLRIRLSSPQCFDGDIEKVSSIRYTLKTSKFKRKKVRILDTGTEQLVKIPSRVYRMENIQELKADNNLISVVPNEIVKLRQLSNLNLANNSLDSLPPDFIQLQFIQSLDLSGNQFGILPDAIYQLKFLKTVDLSNNLMPEIENFESRYLRELNLSSNQISAIPDFKKCLELNVLNLANNQFKSAPVNIPKSLQELNLSNNNLTHLPDDLTSYSNLKVLVLKGNNFSVAEEHRIREMLFYTDLQF